jgi:hypothetical protein
VTGEGHSRGYLHQNLFDPEHVVQLRELAIPAYVVCPTCLKRAEYWTNPIPVFPMAQGCPDIESGKPVFWCAHCIRRETSLVNSVMTRRGSVSVAGFVIWAQAGVGRNTLWAFNASHLNGIEAAIGGAKCAQPPHALHSVLDWRSRIPSWVKSRKNRPAVLHAIAKLRNMLPEPQVGMPST